MSNYELYVNKQLGWTYRTSIHCVAQSCPLCLLHCNATIFRVTLRQTDLSRPNWKWSKCSYNLILVSCNVVAIGWWKTMKFWDTNILWQNTSHKRALFIQGYSENSWKPTLRNHRFQFFSCRFWVILKCWKRLTIIRIIPFGRIMSLFLRWSFLYGTYWVYQDTLTRGLARDYSWSNPV